jgi:Domain of unknown function (DUF4431)
MDRACPLYDNAVCPQSVQVCRRGDNMSGMTVLLALLTNAISSQAVEQRCVEYEPSVVKLEGRIERRVFPGPPNYMSIEKGDQQDVQWVFHLSKPTCVNGKRGSDFNSESEADVSELRLVISNGGDWKRYAPLLGREVLATGTLSHAHTAHHRTAVLLTVRRIEAHPSHEVR